MKLITTTKRILSVSLVSLIFLASGCKKMFDLKPEDSVDYSNAYQTLEDANAAIFGIYGQLMGLADRYVILNELQADLADITHNSDRYLQELSNHEVSKANTYADPRPFYSVILNCNDVLENLSIMNQQHKIHYEDYMQRYSDIVAVRAWVYLQLGIQYGQVPYITKAPKSINDIKNASEYPRLEFDALADTLINQLKHLEAIGYVKQLSYPSSSPLITNIDGSSTLRTFINKYYLLGELNLWRNNYVEAARCFKAVMETETENTNINLRYNTYRIVWADANYDLTIRYTRSQDPGTLVTGGLGWGAMFSLTNTSALWQTEWIWALPYNSLFQPVNPFIDLFSTQGTGKYLIKPSQVAIDGWNSQVQNNGIPYDSRYRLTYTTAYGSPEIYKYNYTYDLSSPLQKNGYWYLWRAAALHLHYSEAANRAGNGKLAWALLNTGIISTYAPGVSSTPSAADLEKMRSGLPAPFDFDARNSGSVSTTYRDPWYKSTGIRTRANLPAIDASYQTNTEGLEEKLIDEGALELAYEGYRWPDLLRIAKRREQLAPGSGRTFLMNKIAAKFTAAGKGIPAGVAKIGVENSGQEGSAKYNWYLPFNWEE